MTNEEKKEFVKGVLANIRIQIDVDIDGGKIPEEWGGSALVLLMEHLIKERTRRSREILGKARIKEFENTCIVNNL